MEPKYYVEVIGHPHHDLWADCFQRYQAEMLVFQMPANHMNQNLNKTWHGLPTMTQLGQPLSQFSQQASDKKISRIPIWKTSTNLYTSYISMVKSTDKIEKTYSATFFVYLYGNDLNI